MSAIYRSEQPMPRGHVLLWCKRIGKAGHGVGYGGWLIGWHWQRDEFLILGCSDDQWEILHWQELPPPPFVQHKQAGTAAKAPTNLLGEKSRIR